MKYRLFFHSLDIKARNREEAITKYFLDGIEPPIAKILLIDKAGNVIKKNIYHRKQREPLDYEQGIE